jgi:murein DD-endopeptidase MepM/ murein hydrolase activator NlpD
MPTQSSRAIAFVRCAAALAVLLVAGALAPDVAAQRGRAPRAGFGESQPAPGLSVVFEPGAPCPPIASPYGALTRYDGSPRQTGGAEGAHGGIDLSLDEGTALRAIAGGRVHSAGEGGMMEGLFLWTLHLPAESGLGFPFLAKYQHLRESSRLAPGTPIRPGQEIARSGKTGTVGGHYGPRGYPHLHLTVRLLTAEGAERAASGGDLRLTRDSIVVDPLIVFVPGLRAPEDAAALAPEAKVLRVATVDDAGVPFPADARSVWPVACR